jgi:S1-C subfamily serine protease
MRSSKRFSVSIVVLATLLFAFSAFGLASPVAAASNIHKHPEHPYIGVEITTKGSDAAVMSVMPNSPADKAGLKKGDVITAVDGKKVTAADISQTVAALQVGKQIKLTIVRDSKQMDITVTLADMPVNTYWVYAADATVLVYHPTQDNWQFVSLNADSALAKAGFKADDLIKSFNGKSYTADTLADFIKGLKKDDMVTVSVERSNKAQDIKVSAADLATLNANPVAFYEDELKTSAQLAITYLPLTSALAKDYAIPVNEGLLIVSASDAMQKAGLKLMDVITAMGDTTLSSSTALSDALAKMKAGDKVTLSVNRAGKTQKVEVTLGGLEDAMHSAAGALSQLFHLKGSM